MNQDRSQNCTRFGSYRGNHRRNAIAFCNTIPLKPNMGSGIYDGGCLIAAEASSTSLVEGDAAGCMVVFAVDIGRRMMELRGTSLQCGRRTSLSQRCNPISGMARLTSRQGHLKRSGPQRCPDLCGGSRIRIEELTSLKHRMHYNGQFARHGHGSSFEADPLSELQTPRAQSAVG
jgi:hypothetical protein